MDKSLKDRLLEFIEFLEMPVRKFEESCGMSNGYVSSIKVGVGKSKLNTILTNYPQLNREWLLYGEGEMIVSDNPKSSNTVTNNSNHSILEEQIKMLEEIIAQKDKLIEQKDKIIEQLLNR